MKRTPHVALVSRFHPGSEKQRVGSSRAGCCSSSPFLGGKREPATLVLIVGPLALGRRLARGAFERAFSEAAVGGVVHPNGGVERGCKNPLNGCLWFKAAFALSANTLPRACNPLKGLTQDSDGHDLRARTTSRVSNRQPTQPRPNRRRFNLDDVVPRMARGLLCAPHARRTDCPGVSTGAATRRRPWTPGTRPSGLRPGVAHEGCTQTLSARSAPTLQVHRINISGDCRPTTRASTPGIHACATIHNRAQAPAPCTPARANRSNTVPISSEDDKALNKADIRQRLIKPGREGQPAAG